MTALTTIKEEKKLDKSPRQRRISAEEYQRMGQAGIFEGQQRVELINGIIYTRSPITPNHTAHTKKADAFLSDALKSRAIVGCQDPVRLNDLSEPEPDISILKWKDDFYLSAHPSPDNIFLLIEIAVFTEQHDRTIKKKNYAESNIAEYWIIIPSKKIIEVYRQPRDGDYTEKVVYTRADSWKLEVFDLEVKGSDFLI